MSALYSTVLLRLALGAAAFPLLDPADARATLTAKPCGSHIALSLSLDEAGRITASGFALTACVVGQAAATVFARAAYGCTLADISRATDAISAWLSGDGPLPDWPDMALLADVIAHPARHNAALLPWRAAHAALAGAAEQGCAA